MTQVWQQWGDVLVASFLALPLMALVVLALTLWRRRRGMPASLAWVRSLTEVGMVAGTVPWIWMILSPGSAPAEVHLVPLRDLTGQLSVGPVFATVQIGGNLLVFAALGFCAPIRLAALAGPVRLFVLGAAGSAFVELLQYQLDLHRVSSVDDVLVNATGAMLAGLASRHWWATRSARPAATPAMPRR
ncbi:VanZ family protein [Micromonospora sp. NPDC049679]|uniref:VanZ family protein n=1 Tax=Micromonospora sp. NPDC049679 TaxID=3155920 RepID=UPI0034111C78